MWWFLWYLLKGLPLFSYNFDVVHSTFLQLLTGMSCSFIISFAAPVRLQKSFKPSFYTSKSPSSSSSLGMLHCWFSASVYLHSSTLLEDDNFCLVCIQNQSLIQPLHCNACYMEYLDHENLSLCVLSTFSTYHWSTYLLFFIASVAIFSNNCDSTSFQIFLYWDTHSFSSKTLDDIELAEFLSFCETP